MAMFLNIRGPRRRQAAVIIAPPVTVAFTVLPSIVGTGKIAAPLVLNLGAAGSATLTGILARASGTIIASVTSGETYTPTGEDDLATLTLTATATIGASTAVASITKAITYDAPVFTLQPTLSPSIATSGAVFALTTGAAPNSVLSVEYFRLSGVTKADEILANMWNSTGESAGAIAYRVRATNSGGFTLSNEITATLNATGTLIGPTRTAAPTVAPNAPVKEGAAQTVTPGTYAVAVTRTQSWQTNGIERATALSYTPPTLTFRDQVLTLVETATEAGNPTPTVTTVSLGPIYGLPTSAAGSLEFNVTAAASAPPASNLTPTSSAIAASRTSPDHTQVEGAALMSWNAGELVVVSLQGRRTSLSAIAALINSVTVGAAGRAFGTGTVITERGLTSATGTAKPVFGMYAVRMASAGSGYLQIDWNMNGGAVGMEATHAHYWAIPNTNAVTPVLEYVTTQIPSSTAGAISLTGDPATAGELIIGGVHVGIGGVGFAASSGTLSDQGFTAASGSSDISAAYLYRLALAADVTANTHSISATYTPLGASFGAAIRIQAA